MLFKFLDEKLSRALVLLNQVIESFKKLDNTHNMKESSLIFDEIRTYIEVSENLLFPAFTAAIPDGKNLLSSVKIRHADLDRVIEKSTMMHVDEPRYEFEECLEAIRDLLLQEQASNQSKIFPLAKQHIPENELQAIEAQIQRHQNDPDNMLEDFKQPKVKASSTV